ncbi:MAG: hypothetical protein WDN00_17170 [Limisphaerales bacterium]
MVAILGFFIAIRNRSSKPGFITAVYALLIFVIYSVIPYKTPWLALNFWLPLSVLAGIGVEWLWLALPKFSRRMMILILIIVVGILIAHDHETACLPNAGG